MYKIPKTETTYSGNPASFTVQSGESIGAVTASIEPVQNYNGYDHPWAAGDGNNKAYWPTLTRSSSSDVDYTILDDGNTLHVEGTASANSTPWAVSQSNTYANMPLGPYPAGDYTIIANGLVGQNTNDRIAFTARYADNTTVSGGSGRISGPSATIPNGTGVAATFTATDEFKIGFYMLISSGTAVNCDVKIQLEKASYLGAWEPYSNICPITGFTGASIYVSPTQNQADATTYTSDWTSVAGTVYAGSYEAVSGKLKARPQYASYNGETLVGPWLSSMDVYAEGTTPTTGAQVVDLGGTETEYALTPQTVTAFVGQNYAWSDLDYTVTATVLSESPFHELAISDSAQTRCRIYFIGDNVDCTDDNDVQTNGTLLRSDPSENDSNSMIDSSSGLSILESFNKEAEASIGLAASYTVSCSFLNRNNSLDGFDYGRCKIYIDVYDSDNSTWIPCPLGVFYFDVPVKRRTRVVSATGYDQMYLLDSIADTWWNGLDWPSGLTITDIIQSLAGTLGLHISANATTNILNGSLSFSSLPFKSVEQTFRDILQFVAEATGTVAMFDRDGALDFRWFSAAQYKGNTFEIDADALDTPCLTIDLAEYTVPAIEQLVVKASNIDVGAAVGTGDNQYAIVNNPFMGGADEATIVTKATPIYNRITGLGAYDPVSLKLISDFSIEAGDIINISYQGTTYQLPIFQQTLTWRGRHVFSTPQSSGSKKRPAQTAPKREEFRSQTQMHEFEVNLERLLSRIESIDGNFTQIEQTVDAISQTVSNQNVTIEDILNPDGEIWSAIKGNETNITNLNNTVEADKDYQRSYIRFLPAEPAIVLGVDSTNAIKLKLVNNVIYFFNGSDDSTDLSLAYAYFNSQEAGADRFVASESVQAGNWKWHQLTNEHFVLDFMG